MSAAYVIALSMLGAEGRLPIAQLGIRYKGKQKIEITRPMLSQVVANFGKLDTGEVPVDYDHAIEIAAGGGQPVPAAGWIKSIDEAPDKDGILWGSVQWTPKAEGMIRAREYKYISPVIDPNIKDNKTGEAQGWTLTSAALTNQPVLKGMPALVLSERGWNNRGDDAVETQTMKVKKLIMADRVAGTVRAILDDDSEVTVQLEGLEKPVQVLRLSDVKRDAKSQEYDFASLNTDGEVLVAGEVFRAQQAQMALSAAVEEGKILPSQRAVYERMALSDLTSFRDLVATMKPQVDLGTKGTGATRGAATDEADVEARVVTAIGQKIAASEGKLDYGSAMRLVLGENPELAAAYKLTMGGRK